MEGFEEFLWPMFNCLAQDISKQNKRLGGKMVVAQALFSRKQREFLTKIIGPDLTFIVLNMTAECQFERIASRHGGHLNETFMNILVQYREMCEPAGKNENNAFNVDIHQNMTRDEVLQKILNIVNK